MSRDSMIGHRGKGYGAPKTCFGERPGHAVAVTGVWEGLVFCNTKAAGRLP